MAVTDPPPSPVDDDTRDIVQAAGRFRIYLGAAAGVGKTFAMLSEGRRRAERGTDIVIGFVETHGRAHTIEMCQGLEAVPRLQVEYRGAVFEEMNLDAILERKPTVALDRRARPYERPRLWTPREALGGRPRDHRSRHIGDLHREHPAPREPR